MSESERKPLPPYLPYRTFGTFLDHIREIGTPSHIDKSVMTQFSGAMQSWLKSGLRYMKLIDAGDVPAPMLEKLAKAQGDERKALLAQVFKSSYGFLNGKIDLEKTTPAKLRDAVADLGANGDTVDKIVAFMVSMAKDANIPVSPLLGVRAPGVRRQRGKPNGASKSKVASIHPDDSVDDERELATAMKKIVLPKSGGSITLSGDINVFNLVGDERALVFALIDKMTEFEAGQGGDDA